VAHDQILILSWSIKNLPRDSSHKGGNQVQIPTFNFRQLEKRDEYKIIIHLTKKWEKNSDCCIFMEGWV